MSKCTHLHTKRGKDIPRRYGSWQSEVCQDCGSYRRRDHHQNLVTGWNGGWRPASEYADDTAEAELD